MGILRFFRSRYRITLPDSSAGLALRLLTEENIPFHDLMKTESGIVFYLYPPYFKRYRSIEGKPFPDEEAAPVGLLSLFLRYRHRLGVPIGAALALILMIFSTFFLWDIRVTGTENIPESVIFEALEKEGITLGAFIPKLDTERAEGELLLSVEGLSFVSLNRRGTVLLAELRERSPSEGIIDRSAPSNLVAAEDGQVEALEIMGGVPLCKVGQTVKKGELLIGGVIDSPAFGTRLVRARGEVYARVSETFSVHIPYESVEKVPTGRKFTKKTLKIFGKSIKLFGKDGVSSISCDIIERERRLYLFGIIKLPLTLRETIFTETEEVTVTRTKEEALALGEKALREKRTASLSEAEILSREQTAVETETGITLWERVDLVRNIAKEVKLGAD